MHEENNSSNPRIRIHPPTSANVSRGMSRIKNKKIAPQQHEERKQVKYRGGGQNRSNNRIKSPEESNYSRNEHLIDPSQKRKQEAPLAAIEGQYGRLQEDPGLYPGAK
ncbi:hypothetical protein C922_03311 [Plasmodium inui San Antonio 1]|uniref:Uncharacterized protein n=1 Tax=Plasmodium inui San Antonio 1 TaxID=1237626 RepID=W7A404_9APIC|nr:hypothetical protein C922_03311 [Plasmodium inui San Antonio 1]EUD66395.1 hypothetical protein C922_03311 [Plasmodium inui San Antonio 1]